MLVNPAAACSQNILAPPAWLGGGQGRLPGLKVTLPWYLGFPSAPLESQGHQDLLTSWYSGYKAFTRVSVSWTYFLEGRASPSVSVWLGGTTWDR